MIGVISKLTIRSGVNAAQFETAMRPIVAKMRAAPGNKLCTLFKIPEASAYLLVERFDDQAAFDAHRKSPNFEDLRLILIDHLSGRPDTQVMQEVG